MITGQTIVFYLLAGFTLASAVLSVTSRQIFRSAIYLLFSLLGVAGLYFWLSYDFVAAVQVVVYAGGIAVLIIFSVFLTQRSGEDLPAPETRRVLFSALAAICGLGLLMVNILQHGFRASVPSAKAPVMSEVGLRMLGTGDQGFALPFEAVSILLLAAMIGCIVIAMRSKNQTT
jgi:NADH-quinone oxidoreductase subunit J